MKTLFKIFVIVLLADIIIGFSMSYLAQSMSGTHMMLHIIDEIISFPLVLWNRLFPEYGIFRATSNNFSFWMVIILNAFFQALIVYGIWRLFKKRKR